MTVEWYGAKLHMGSGGRPLHGWVNADGMAGPGVDVVLDLNDGGLASLPAACLERVYGSHVIEHVYSDRLPTVLRHLHRALRPAGVLTLATISLDGIYRNAFEMGYSREAVNSYLYGDAKSSDHPFQAHRQVFTAEWLTAYLIDAGFVSVRPWRLADYPEIAALKDCASSSYHVTLYLEAMKER